jgi:3-deoxy-D-arabino-heptulosonate 7-phosphate (DAHP) synthase
MGVIGSGKRSLVLNERGVTSSIGIRCFEKARRKALDWNSPF